MDQKTTKVILQNQKGLSLFEILISLSLIAIAGTLIVVNVNDSFTEGKIESTGYSH